MILVRQTVVFPSSPSTAVITARFDKTPPTCASWPENDADSYPHGNRWNTGTPATDIKIGPRKPSNQETKCTQRCSWERVLLAYKQPFTKWTKSGLQNRLTIISSVHPLRSCNESTTTGSPDSHLSGIGCSILLQESTSFEVRENWRVVLTPISRYKCVALTPAAAPASPYKLQLPERGVRQPYLPTVINSGASCCDEPGRTATLDSRPEQAERKASRYMDQTSNQQLWYKSTPDQSKLRGKLLDTWIKPAICSSGTSRLGFHTGEVGVIKLLRTGLVEVTKVLTHSSEKKRRKKPVPTTLLYNDETKRSLVEDRLVSVLPRCRNLNVDESISAMRFESQQQQQPAEGVGLARVLQPTGEDSISVTGFE
ncbi:hypothetical protein RRG08_016958 [Elysia crispata]|uniref:Uncharacterized protein n=1 Tax=Elysia crispata TaxID=231223 RepID=A0AAE1A732_9GAST|nr:hypothetical protein RRG08_016958 [Elysia crispata]